MLHFCYPLPKKLYVFHQIITDSEEIVIPVKYFQKAYYIH